MGLELKKSKKTYYKYQLPLMQLKLEILSGVFSPGDPIPSLNQLVERFPISKITARRVQEELVQAGLVCAESGRGVFVREPTEPVRPPERLSPGYEVALLADSDAETQLGAILRGMQDQHLEVSHRMTVHLTGESEAVEAKTLYDLFAQGVRHFVVFPVWGHTEQAPNLNLPVYLELIQRGAHVLLISNNCQTVGLSSLGWHVRHLMREMTDACRQTVAANPVLLLPAGDFEDTEHYIEGFKAGLKRNGYQIPAEGVHVVGGSGESRRQRVCEQMQRLVRRHSPIDAVFCVSAEITLEVLQALDRLTGVNRKVWIFGCGMRNTNLRHPRHPVIFFETNPLVLGRRIHERLTGGSSEQQRLTPKHEWLTAISVHPRN